MVFSDKHCTKNNFHLTSWNKTKDLGSYFLKRFAWIQYFSYAVAVVSLIYFRHGKWQKLPKKLLCFSFLLWRIHGPPPINKIVSYLWTDTFIQIGVSWFLWMNLFSIVSLELLHRISYPLNRFTSHLSGVFCWNILELLLSVSCLLRPILELILLHGNLITCN